MPDPVSWKPNSAPHVEAPVVVGQTSRLDAQDAPSPHVVGAVHGWTPAGTVDPSAVETRPCSTPSPPVIASTGRKTRVQTEDLSSREVAVVRETPTRPEFPRAPITSDPISKRNHIKDGATTYVDAMQRRFHLEHVNWWRHEVAIPLFVAGGAVALLLFAMV
jgi:hypothetical protein